MIMSGGLIWEKLSIKQKNKYAYTDLILYKLKSFIK